MTRYYDRSGQPLTETEWANTYNEATPQRVAQDQVKDSWISTVWLGINHAFRDDAPPLIFETMIFGGGLDQEQWRYTTEAEALAGHAHAVELAKMDQLVVP